VPSPLPFYLCSEKCFYEYEKRDTLLPTTGAATVEGSMQKVVSDIARCEAIRDVFLISSTPFGTNLRHAFVTKLCFIFVNTEWDKRMWRAGR